MIKIKMIKQLRELGVPLKTLLMHLLSIEFVSESMCVLSVVWQSNFCPWNVVTNNNSGTLFRSQQKERNLTSI